MNIKSCGIEIELPVVCAETGNSTGAYGFIEDIFRQWNNAELHPFSCKHGFISAGYDNAYNNVEFSIGAVKQSEGGLVRLNQDVAAAMSAAEKVLADRGLAVINMSEHPFFSCTDEEYKKLRIPRPIYDYWNNHRKWKHISGIDAKAQISPCTGISPKDALSALNIVMGFSPVFIALYGNSPFENGRKSGFCANRLNMWEKMFAETVFSGDNFTRLFPSQPFGSFYDYFNWMLGDGTAMHAVRTKPCHFKEKNDLFIVDGSPALLDFIRGDRWEAKELYSGRGETIAPQTFHFEYHQFAQFSDARIRFGLCPDTELKKLIFALESGADYFDGFFTEHSDYTYIEGRVPCTNLPDKELIADAGSETAKTVIISSSALQKGLLLNSEEALGLINETGWDRIKSLRNRAVSDGMKDDEIKNLCREAIYIAGKGLDIDERRMLAYPAKVLSRGENGAQRTLRLFDGMDGSDDERLRAILKDKIFVNPYTC